MVSPTIKLNSGHEMPLVGFGLWKVDNATAADTVYNAIKVGYRLFDGACGEFLSSHNGQNAGRRGQASTRGGLYAAKMPVRGSWGDKPHPSPNSQPGVPWKEERTTLPHHTAASPPDGSNPEPHTSVYRRMRPGELLLLLFLLFFFLEKKNTYEVVMSEL